MTWAGVRWSTGWLVRGRRVQAMWLDNDESLYWGYDEEWG